RVRPSGVPLGREVGVLGAPRLEALLPLLLELGAALGLVEVLVDAVGDEERLVRVPAEDLLRRADLVLAERRAVRLGRVLLVRRRPADDRLDADERRALGLVDAGL